MLGVLRTDDTSAKLLPGPLPPQPGVGQLSALVEWIRYRAGRHSIRRRRPVPGSAPPPNLTAYRIVQEALTNTLRHAAAGHAWVTISYDEPEVRIRVADDGIPVIPAEGVPGHGIQGMRERAALHHGALHAGLGGRRRLRGLVEATLRAKVNGTVPPWRASRSCSSTTSRCCDVASG